MAEGTYKLIKENSESTYDEKEVQAESGKVLGFDSGLNPVMVDPGTSGDSVTDVFVEQDPQFPIEYLKYTKDGVDYDITSIAKANGLIWGGFVSWLGLLSFSVTPALYYLFAVLYKILDTTIVTLDAADPENPRIDVIAVDNTETVIVIKGTPAVNPQKPSIDPETQIELTYVLIPAGATEPEDIDQSIIYDENTEWTGAGSGVTVDFDNATTPFHLSKCASVGTITNNDTITFSTGVPVNVVDFKNLILYLKLKAAMTSKHNLYAAWMRSGVLVSNEVVLPISKSNVTSWQSIAIQLTAFTWSQSTVDALRLRWSKSGPNVAHAGFYLDFVKLETGIIQQVVNSAIILTGDVTGSGVTGSPVPTTLATVNSNVGQFGDATNVPKITVDGKGRVTAIENVSVTIPPAITPTSDPTPVDTDEVVSLRGTSWLKTTWTVLKAFLKTYFDNVYSAINHAHTFLSLTDTPAAYTGMAGKVAKVNVGENGIEFGDPGASATTFLALTDTPAAYTGQAGKYPKVNVAENALEFDIPGAGDFALKALSNLASVAINTSLISDTDSTDDLGSSAKYWKNLYTDTGYFSEKVGVRTTSPDAGIHSLSDDSEFTTLHGHFQNINSNGAVEVRVEAGTALSCGYRLLAHGAMTTNWFASILGAANDSGKAVMCAQGASMSEFLIGSWSSHFGYRAPVCIIVGNKISAAFVDGGNVGLGGLISDTSLTGAKLVVKGATGNVGISTISPVTRLDLGNHANSMFKAGGFEIGSYGINNCWFTNNAYYDGSWKYRAAGYAADIYFYNGTILFHTAASGLADGSITFNERLKMTNAGQFGFGVTSPTATIHLKAGTATAGTSPLKFTSGTLLGTNEAGAVEFLTDTFFVTITTGAARKGIITDDGARLTSGKIPIATVNGRLIDGQTPLAGTKVYYVADSSGEAVTRKLTFINGILTSET